MLRPRKMMDLTCALSFFISYFKHAIAASKAFRPSSPVVGGSSSFLTALKMPPTQSLKAHQMSHLAPLPRTSHLLYIYCIQILFGR